MRSGVVRTFSIPVGRDEGRPKGLRDVSLPPLVAQPFSAAYAYASIDGQEQIRLRSP